MEHPFWRSKFTLTDPEDIRRILESGIAEVLIDTDKGLDVPQAPKAEREESVADLLMKAEIAQHARSSGPVSMSEELQRAAMICAKAKKAVVSMFREVRMGNAISAEAAGELVEEISSSVLRNPGALISLARLKTVDDYTYMHCVAVCALMVSLARQLGLDEKDMREAGMAGLMHDLGKAMMPMEVLNKPGKLTDDEFRVIKTHPVEGHRLLVEGKTASDIVLDVCLHHHEKVDGSGYPDRLDGDSISLFAKMGAVCDVYDAITSNRPYKAGWDPAESIRKMTEWSKGHFDERVFQAFIKSIGIYPVGSLVMLRSGRLAVVVEQSEKSLLAPRVKVFFSTKSQTYIVPELIDLSHSGATEKIASREDAVKWGIKNLDELWVT
jgi:putative nucleotidyltransferase with HDIG domain